MIIKSLNYERNGLATYSKTPLPPFQYTSKLMHGKQISDNYASLPPSLSIFLSSSSLLLPPHQVSTNFGITTGRKHVSTLFSNVCDMELSQKLRSKFFSVVI